LDHPDPVGPSRRIPISLSSMRWAHVGAAMSLSPATRFAAPLRIAVVGSGVAALSSAWLLSQRHRVTLYEKADRLGGHSNTVIAGGSAGGRRGRHRLHLLQRRDLPEPHRAL
jgi:NADPH-dependent 2,4-dienoyl-CoA reductase/sulfur reductase-like enzyme